MVIFGPKDLSDLGEIQPSIPSIPSTPSTPSTSRSKFSSSGPAGGSGAGSPRDCQAGRGSGANLSDGVDQVKSVSIKFYKLDLDRFQRNQFTNILRSCEDFELRFILSTVAVSNKNLPGRRRGLRALPTLLGAAARVGRLPPSRRRGSRSRTRPLSWCCWILKIYGNRWILRPFYGKCMHACDFLWKSTEKIWSRTTNDP